MFHILIDALWNFLNRPGSNIGFSVGYNAPDYSAQSDIGNFAYLDEPTTTYIQQPVNAVNAVNNGGGIFNGGFSTGASIDVGNGGINGGFNAAVGGVPTFTTTTNTGSFATAAFNDNNNGNNGNVFGNGGW